MNARRKLHILVMSASWQSALACIQSFGRAGHTVSILVTGYFSPNYASIFISNRFRLSAAGMNEVARELLQLVEQKGIDLVIPISDSDTLLVAIAKGLSQKADAFLVSPLESIKMAINRNKTMELCKTLGIDTPKTHFVTRENVAVAARNLGYPCFLKLSGTVASKGVFEIRSEEELHKQIETLPRKVEMQIQEKIDGDFVDITGFAHEGKVRESFSFCADYVHSKAGTPPYASRIVNGGLEVILSKVASELNWTGAVDLDLLRKRDGTLLLLEINPRFSGTTVFPLKLGVNLPMHYVDAFLEKDGPTQSKPGTPTAERFVSLFEETMYLRSAGEEGARYSVEFRRDGNWVDNAFWDDWRYSASLFEVTRRWLIYSKN